MTRTSTPWSTLRWLRKRRCSRNCCRCNSQRSKHVSNRLWKRRTNTSTTWLAILQRSWLNCERACSTRENGLDYVENQTRRNNLRIDGVTESPGETWADKEAAVRKTFATSLKFSERQANDIRIERAHRTGGDNHNHSGKPKTVVVKFESYKDRDTVMRKEKPRGVYINEDLSQRVMARRRELMPRLREVREQGKIAYLTYDKLVVRDRVERA